MSPPVPPSGGDWRHKLTQFLWLSIAFMWAWIILDLVQILISQGQ